MDKHYLTPLFSPASIVVFAGDPDEPAAQTPYARAVLGVGNAAPAPTTRPYDGQRAPAAAPPEETR